MAAEVASVVSSRISRSHRRRPASSSASPRPLRCQFPPRNSRYDDGCELIERRHTRAYIFGWLTPGAGRRLPVARADGQQAAQQDHPRVRAPLRRGRRPQGAGDGAPVPAAAARVGSLGDLAHGAGGAAAPRAPGGAAVCRARQLAVHQPAPPARVALHGEEPPLRGDLQVGPPPPRLRLRRRPPRAAHFARRTPPPLADRLQPRGVPKDAADAAPRAREVRLDQPRALGARGARRLGGGRALRRLDLPPVHHAAL